MLSAKQLLKKNGENIFAWAEDRFINYLTNWEWIRISINRQIRFEYVTCGRGNFGIRKEKFADSKRLSGYVWMGPKTISFLMFSCRTRRRFGSKNSLFGSGNPVCIHCPCRCPLKPQGSRQEHAYYLYKNTEWRLKSLLSTKLKMMKPLPIQLNSFVLKLNVTLRNSDGSRCGNDNWNKHGDAIRPCSRLNLRKASGGENFPSNVFVAFVVEVA